MAEWDVVQPQAAKDPWAVKATPATADPWAVKAEPAAPAQRGALDKIFGLTGERYQFWPERMVRSAVTLPHDVMTGKQPTQDPTGANVTPPSLIERTQDLAAFAVPGNISRVPGARPGMQPRTEPVAAPASEAIPPQAIRPSKEYVLAQEDRLHNLTTLSDKDKTEFLQATEKLPPELKNEQAQEKIYHHMEDPKVELTPVEQAAHAQYIAPLQAERGKLFNEITGAGYPLEDLQANVHRIAKGKGQGIETLSGAESGDPIGGYGGRTLPRTTSSLQHRSMLAIEREGAPRRVVSVGEGGVRIWRNGTSLPISNETKLRPGDVLKVDGKEWQVKQATTKEIEESTPVRYQKNAWINTVDDVVRLRRVARAVQYLEELKRSPAWKQFATDDTANAPRHWKHTDLPQLREWKMDPKLANVFNDFYGHGRTDLGEALAKVNRFATRSIFWNPVPHVENVLVHWATERGFDWVKPAGIKSLFVDSAKAIKSTVTLDNTYKDLLKHGSALQYARTQNKGFLEAMAKKMGVEFERDPDRYGPIFRRMGFNGLFDGIKAYYDAMAGVLWGATDAMMIQRVLELERQGLSRTAAIKEAERHIPNYRIPSEVMGSRAASEVLQNPNIFVFTRYHYGQWKSYADMVRTMAHGTAQERIDTAGKMAALGAIMFGVYPLIDNAIQNLTGNPDAKKLRRGAATIPYAIKEMYEGDRTLPSFINNVMTIAPASKEIGEQLTGVDWFTNRPIADPSDFRNQKYAKVAAQIVDHAAKGILSPYQMIDQYTKDSEERTILRKLVDQLVGMQDPTERQLRGKSRAFRYQDRAAAKRRPGGLLERGVGLFESTE